MFYLNDTKNNSYADNNYYFVLSLNGMNVDNGYYRSIDCLNKTNMYSELKNSIERISQLDYVKVVNCGVDFDESYKNLNLEIIVNESNYPVQDKSLDLISKGIMVGHYYMGIKLKNYILKCRKFIGSSNDHDITILDKNWNKIGSANIDERGYNTLRVSDDSPVSNWISEEFNKMKLSDPKYGTYNGRDDGKEGSARLYAQDFFLWLKDNEL